MFSLVFSVFHFRNITSRTCPAKLKLITALCVSPKRGKLIKVMQQRLIAGDIVGVNREEERTIKGEQSDAIRIRFLFAEITQFWGDTEETELI